MKRIEFLTIKMYNSGVRIDTDINYKEDFFRYWLGNKVNIKEKERFIDYLKEQLFKDLEKIFEDFKKNLK